MNDNDFTRFPQYLDGIERTIIDMRNNPLRSLNYSAISLLNEGRLRISLKFLTEKAQLIYNNYERHDQIDDLYKYYRKSPEELAIQYVSHPKSLSNDEIERLIHEAGKSEIKFLENNLAADNLILSKIINRLSVELSNTLKILL